MIDFDDALDALRALFGAAILLVAFVVIYFLLAAVEQAMGGG